MSSVKPNICTHITYATQLQLSSYSEPHWIFSVKTEANWLRGPDTTVAPLPKNERTDGTAVFPRQPRVPEQTVTMQGGLWCGGPDQTRWRVADLYPYITSTMWPKPALLKRWCVKLNIWYDRRWCFSLGVWVRPQVGRVYDLLSSGAPEQLRQRRLIWVY